MKRAIIIMLAALLSGGLMTAPAYASQWDKAGKALTVIEGLRILTGGRVDVIGSITGVNRYGTYGDHHDKYRPHYRKKQNHHRRHRPYNRHHHYKKCRERIWIPHFVYREEYIPEHETYDEKYGYIIVKSRTITQKIEDGGHWETRHTCGY